MSEWQPKETAPKDGTSILGCFFAENEPPEMIVVSYDGSRNGGYPWATLDGICYAAGAMSHWMTLPEPPRVDSQSGRRR